MHFDDQQIQGLQVCWQAQQRLAEPQRLADGLRRDYPELMARRSDAAALLQELGEALARCDELGLADPEDRRIFCQWDQLLVPGMRHLAQWPQWLDHCRKRQAPGEHSLLLRMLLETPPAWWQRQMAQHQQARQRRGLPDMHEVVAQAQRGAAA